MYPLTSFAVQHPPLPYQPTGAITLPVVTDTAEGLKGVLSLLVLMWGIRFSIKIASLLFGTPALTEGALIFGLSLSVYIFVFAFENLRKGQPRSVELSNTGLLLALLTTFALCGLARVVPFLRV